MKNNKTETLKRFNYLTSEINAAYHEVSLKCSLSDSETMVLYAVCNNGEVCLLNDIIHLSGLSKQTINSAVRKLEGKDVVYLETAEGRKKRVCLTDKGKLLVKNTVRRVIEIENDIYGDWSDAEQKLYIELTQRYLSSFRKKIKELV